MLDDLLPNQSLDGAPELYRLMYKVLNTPLNLYHRLQTEGLDNLPEEGTGGVIVCPLHNGMFDAAFVSLAVARRGRPVRWVVDDEIMENPMFAPLIENVGAIAISSHKGRTKDPEAAAATIAELARMLKEEDITAGVFPEGEIPPFYKKPEPGEFKTGIIRLAIQSGAPIVPAWASGAQKIMPWLTSFIVDGAEIPLALPLWLPIGVTVHFGEPFHVDAAVAENPTREGLRAETERLRDAMQALVG